MPDTSYANKVYMKQGGDEQVVASGGKVTVETGGQVNAAAGTVLIDSKKATNGFYVHAVLPGALPATAANFGPFFVAPVACEVVSVREAHTALGADAGAVTLDIEKLTGTQAPGAGVAVLGATKVDLKGAIDTVQAPALTGTAADKVLAIGDRLSLKLTGTPTAVAGLAALVELKLA